MLIILIIDIPGVWLAIRFMFRRSCPVWVQGRSSSSTVLMTLLGSLQIPEAADRVNRQIVLFHKNLRYGQL